MPKPHELDDPSVRTNVSEDGRRLFTPIPLLFQQGDQKEVTCMTRNATHAEYWPVALNARRMQGSWNTWLAFNASCQANATNTKPMLTDECLSFLPEGCSLDRKRATQIRLRFGDVLMKRQYFLDSNRIIEEWNATVMMSNFSRNYNETLSPAVCRAKSAANDSKSRLVPVCTICYNAALILALFRTSAILTTFSVL